MSDATHSIYFIFIFSPFGWENVFLSLYCCPKALSNQNICNKCYIKNVPRIWPVLTLKHFSFQADFLYRPYPSFHYPCQGAFIFNEMGFPSFFLKLIIWYWFQHWNKMILSPTHILYFYYEGLWNWKVKQMMLTNVCLRASSSQAVPFHTEWQVNGGVGR